MSAKATENIDWGAAANPFDWDAVPVVAPDRARLDEQVRNMTPVSPPQCHVSLSQRSVD